MEQAISQDSSRRITALRFLLIVFVVFIHAELTVDDALNYYRLDFAQPFWIEWLKGFVCGTLGGAAVPLFFMFSAYVQFSKGGSYTALLKRRTRTLLAPYIAWTLITIALFAAAQQIPEAAPFFQNEANIVKNWSALDWLKAFTYFNSNGRQPIVYQFWFIRDLMILIAISPALRLIFKKTPCASAAAVSAAFLCGIPAFIVSTTALFFYAAGYFFAQGRADFFAMADRIRLREYAVLIALLEAARIFLKAEAGPVMTLISCLLFLKISGFIARRGRLYALSERLSGLSFFVYAVHAPFISSAVNKISWRVIPLQGTFCLVQFLAAAIITLSLSVLFGIALRKLCPPLFSLLNGGRAF